MRNYIAYIIRNIDLRTRAQTNTWSQAQTGAGSDLFQIQADAEVRQQVAQW